MTQAAINTGVCAVHSELRYRVEELERAKALHSRRLDDHQAAISDANEGLGRLLLSTRHMSDELVRIRQSVTRVLHGQPELKVISPDDDDEDIDTAVQDNPLVLRNKILFERASARRTKIIYAVCSAIVAVGSVAAALLK